MFHHLKGIRVLDLSSVVLGPFASQLLGDLGAEVIKVEPPEGDIFRSAAPARNRGMGAGFLNLNRNKRSLALDLKSARGREVLYRLVARADVLLHNMRPGAVARLGLESERLLAANPSLVYCAAVGFGGDGPYAGEPAYDDVMQAVSGLASLPMETDREPAFIPTVLVDKICGLYTAFGIVSALLARERGGQGGAVETPMFESMVSFLMAEHLGGHVFDPPLGGLRYQRVMSPHRRPYRTADGYIAVLPYATKHWQSFFRLVGEETLAGEAWLADASQRSERVGELYQALAEAMPSRTTAEWLAALKPLDIPCSPVNRLENLLDDPHLTAVRFFRRVEHPSEGALTSLRHPLRFPGAEEQPDLPAPALGQQGAEILGEHGFSAEEIEQLVNAGVLVPGN